MNDKKSKFPFKLNQFLILPIFLGIVLLALTTIVELLWLKVTLMFLASALVGIKLQRQHAKTDSIEIVAPELKQDTEQWMHDLSEVIVKAIEVSSLQIENSRVQTEEAITQMSTRFTSLVVRLNSALDAATSAMEKDLLLEEEGSSTITDVLQSLEWMTKDMSESSEILKNENEEIVREVNEIIMSLQFQDRTSQILLHVVDALNSLPVVINEQMQKVMSGETTEINVENILDTLKLNYTTAEEVSLHEGGAAKAKAFDDVELF